MWWVQGGLNKEGKERKEKKRKGKHPRLRKGGVSGCDSGGKAASIAAMSKRGILVLVALGKSIDLNTNC